MLSKLEVGGRGDGLWEQGGRGRDVCLSELGGHTLKEMTGSGGVEGVQVI